MTTVTVSTTAGWATDRLDLHRYLGRLRIAADSVTADVDGLRTLHRAHATTIPFENLDVVMGRGIDLDMDVLQEKLLLRERGGYCFEHNLLFAAALEQLGYPVVRLAARVHPDRPGPKTHLLLLALAGGRWWVADVGFGGRLLEPLPLTPGTVTQDGWIYRLSSTAGTWRLQVLSVDDWRDLYEFSMEPLEPIDCEVHNHYTATHPRSPFTGRIVAFQTAPGRRRLLKGRTLFTEHPDTTSVTRHLTVPETFSTLHETFGIQLERSEVDLLAPLLQEA